MKATHVINCGMIFIDLSMEKQFSDNIIEPLLEKIKEVLATRYPQLSPEVHISWSPNHTIIIDYHDINQCVITAVEMIWAFIDQYNDALYKLNKILSNFNK